MTAAQDVLQVGGVVVADAANVGVEAGFPGAVAHLPCELGEVLRVAELVTVEPLKPSLPADLAQVARQRLIIDRRPRDQEDLGFYVLHGQHTTCHLRQSGGLAAAYGIVDGMSYRWLTVFLDFPADAFGSGAAFWQAVTGSGRSAYRGPAGEFATLLPPSGDPYLRVQRLAAGDGGCHLDLHADTAVEPLAAAGERARSLGARLLHAEDGLIVAESPAGFTFCLVPWDGERVVPSPLPGDAGATRVDTLCIDVPPAEFSRECAFWSALTGWEARPAPFPEYAFLRMPPQLPIRIILQRLENAAPGQRARAHVDFGCPDPTMVAHHVALGAREITRQEHWTVLADPADREYCLVNRPPIA